MPPPQPDDPDPQVREIAMRFVAMHQAAATEAQRIQKRRQRREFLRLVPSIIIGTAFCALIGAGIGWGVIQILKP